MIPTIKNYEGGTIHEKVTSWALQNGVTEREIDLLKELMLEWRTATLRSRPPRPL